MTIGRSSLPGLLANKTPRNKKKRDVPPFPLLPPPVQHKKQKVVASDEEDEEHADGAALTTPHLDQSERSREGSPGLS